MKKLFILTFIFCAVISTSMYAQSGPQAQNTPDPAVLLQQMKEKQKPGLIEKVGLTEAQADKLIEINFEMRMAASGLRDLNEADRNAKMAELKATKEKKISELLTADQIKAVNAYFQDMGKNRQVKAPN